MNVDTGAHRIAPPIGNGGRERHGVDTVGRGGGLAGSEQHDLRVGCVQQEIHRQALPRILGSRLGGNDRSAGGGGGKQFRHRHAARIGMAAVAGKLAVGGRPVHRHARAHGVALAVLDCRPQHGLVPAVCQDGRWGRIELRNVRRSRRRKELGFAPALEALSFRRLDFDRGGDRAADHDERQSVRIGPVRRFLDGAGPAQGPGNGAPGHGFGRDAADLGRKPDAVHAVGHGGGFRARDAEAERIDAHFHDIRTDLPSMRIDGRCRQAITVDAADVVGGQRYHPRPAAIGHGKSRRRTGPFDRGRLSRARNGHRKAEHRLRIAADGRRQLDRHWGVFLVFQDDFVVALDQVHAHAGQLAAARDAPRLQLLGQGHA